MADFSAFGNQSEVFDEKSLEMAGQISALGDWVKGSDLLSGVVCGINTLIGTVGEDEAEHIVESLDNLENKGLVSLAEISSILTATTDTEEAEGGRLRAIGTDVLDSKNELEEVFCDIQNLPKAPVLSRDLLAMDGAVFVTKGIEITPLIAQLIKCLDKLHFLNRDDRRHPKWGTGVYVFASTVSNNESNDIAQGVAADKAIPVSDVVAGQKVSRGVFTTDGRLYLTPGTELTPKIVVMLQDLMVLGNIAEDIWVGVEE